jgi:AraC-like DNA-binding protein
MAEPPGLQELADEIGLNLKKLKMGFKQIYGDTVYGFLFDYKMDFARKLLDSGSYNERGRIKNRIQHRKSFHRRIQKNLLLRKKKYLMSINPNT